ncbi:hypothetical protein AKJ09_09842 [Labilithrix luteola]|uniref:Uncharacterized protein n=1 Tax=Labilithrix luteola TaxID=1391654 RepID=A0A0K1QBQ2_9BACT|nr:hypothetical protein AKJ09_09842 [Labilithrix luteola]
MQYPLETVRLPPRHLRNAVERHAVETCFYLSNAYSEQEPLSALVHA